MSNKDQISSRARLENKTQESYVLASFPEQNLSSLIWPWEPEPILKILYRKLLNKYFFLPFFKL